MEDITLNIASFGHPGPVYDWSRPAFRVVVVIGIFLCLVLSSYMKDVVVQLCASLGSMVVEQQALDTPEYNHRFVSPVHAMTCIGEYYPPLQKGFW